jgi:predicted lipid-binding transport protein (Tim44 family)
MNGLPVDILLYALVAAGLVFWLRSVLGTRHGDERERPNPFTPAPAEKPAYENFDGAPTLAIAPAVDQPVMPRNVSVANATAEQGLDDIAQSDLSFDPAIFATAAQDAFVIIVEAFAKGERDTLRDLLADPVFNAFSGALDAREKKGESVSTEIHAVRKADITDARLTGKDAYITIRFTADETCVIRDRDQKIISGDPDRITEMVDLWTFTRNVKSKDPRWMVCETRDGDIIEEHKTPMPESF